MSNKININDYLSYSTHEGSGGQTFDYIIEENLIPAIKNIIGAVILKCAEEASLNGRTYNSKTKELKDITNEIGGDCYWDGHPEDQPYPDLTIEINKNSIINVEKMINYE